MYHPCIVQVSWNIDCLNGENKMARVEEVCAILLESEPTPDVILLQASLVPRRGRAVSCARSLPRGGCAPAVGHSVCVHRGDFFFFLTRSRGGVSKAPVLMVEQGLLPNGCFPILASWYSIFFPQGSIEEGGSGYILYRGHELFVFAKKNDHDSFATPVQVQQLSRVLLFV